MTAADAYPHDNDLALIPFRFDGERNHPTFVLTPDIARHAGVLSGGTGAAASVMAMEAATQRDALWVVTQFVSYARLGERIEVEAQSLANGKRIAQVQVVARVDDRVIFTALGATATPRPGGLTGQYETMPRATAPDHSPPLHRRMPAAAEEPEIGFGRNLEFREAVLDDPEPRAMALWARLTPPRRDVTRAGIAFLADMIPGAVARAAGKLGGGFSLDNALRFADVPPTEWVLLHLRGDVATNGYGHGSFTAWSSDGALLATGSQTASMAHIFEGPDDPKLQEWQQSIARAAAEGGTRG
jgi:acyl-CoA thioesterase